MKGEIIRTIAVVILFALLLRGVYLGSGSAWLCFAAWSGCAVFCMAVDEILDAINKIKP